jgi:CubicO group peptidase (beta-lactamase class C family)
MLRKSCLHLLPSLGVALMMSTAYAETAVRLEQITAALEAELRDARFSGILDVEVDSKNTYRFSGSGTESKVKPGVDSVFWVGSVSKQFGAVAVLKLVDQGKLTLDVPVKRYLPQLAAALRTGGMDCTVAHVLHHTCGLPTRNVCTNIRMDRVAGQKELIGCVASLSLESTPGTKYAYSNVGYDLIGALVEEVAGISYRAFVQKELLDPLGMNRTGIDLGANAKARSALVQGQLFNGFGWTDTWPWVGLSPEGLGTNGPSGNIFSTARDLHLWNSALHGGRVLKATTYQRLVAPDLDEYGLGIGVETSTRGIRWFWHNGSVTPMGWSSFVAFIPSTKTSIVGLANRTRHTSHIMRATKSLVMASLGEEVKRPYLEAPTEKDYAVEMVFFIVPGITVLAGLLLLWQLWRGPRGQSINWYGKLLGNGMLYFFGITMFDSFGRAAYLGPVLFVVFASALLAHRRRLDFDIARAWKARKERRGLLALMFTLSVLLYVASWAARMWFAAFFVVEGVLVLGLIKVRQGNAVG